MRRNLNRRRFIETGGAIALTAYLGALRAQQNSSASTFDADATAEEVTAGLNLSGLNVVVTGCNSGIGYETMRVLALRGAHVIGTARSVEKGREACNSVEGRATPVVLELSDFDSCAACAEQIKSMDVPIDALINNAGVLYTDLHQIRGLEAQFVVNHLGHFVLTQHLLEQIKAARQGRVVVVGSVAHSQVPDGGIQFDDLSGQSWGGGYYGHSKLANGLFSLELAKRLRGTNATSNCLHPGVVATNIMRNMNLPAGAGGAGFSFETPEMGAANSCYVATNPSLVGVSGQYFVDFKTAAQSAHQTDEAMAARLWEVSEALTRDYLSL